MAGQSVQFYGKEKVLQAYNARGIDTWGLFDKKQFINAGESAEDLGAFLDMLQPGGSQSTYTLKVYRDIDDIDLLTDRTECNGSFNFKLHGSSAETPAVVNGAGGGARYADPIYAKLQGVINEEVSNAIDKRLNGGKENNDEDWNDIIKGYAKDPNALATVLNAIGNIFRPGQAAMGMPVALAGVDYGTTEHAQPVHRVGSVGSLNNEEKLQRLSVALDKWEKADPDALTVIEKIVKLAESDKAKYNMAKGFL